jgi:4-hydroxy-tetrahydrodipicolinate reductase
MKFALIGYGKMGKIIEQIIQETGNGSDEVVLKITSQNLHELTVENLRQADVAIEFTEPNSAVGNMNLCFEAGVPVVVGTTAWLAQLEEVKTASAAKEGGLFFSPNFSIGVNIFWEVNKKLAQLMNRQPQYTVSMEEIHHTEKKDAPSGTAVKTAEVILDHYTLKTGWELAESAAAESDKLLIVAKREPHVPGTHTVTYQSSVDFIQLTHEAVNRRGFAEGAVLAARFMVGKKGVYGMSDLLQL